MSERTVIYQAWAGFCEGRIDLAWDERYPDYARIYRTKKEARRRYEDVRRVEIHVRVSGKRK